MKLNVERPAVLVDIKTLAMDKVETARDGSLILGSLTRNSDIAHHPLVLRELVF